jgi:hypothetical protein
VQALLDVHDTSFSSLGPPLPRRLSVRWIVHREPFPPPASVVLGEPWLPTAKQAFVVVHDTWLSCDVRPPRLGVLCADHLVACR